MPARLRKVSILAESQLTMRARGPREHHAPQKASRNKRGTSGTGKQRRDDIPLRFATGMLSQAVRPLRYP